MVAKCFDGGWLLLHSLLVAVNNAIESQGYAVTCRTRIGISITAVKLVQPQVGRVIRLQKQCSNGVATPAEMHMEKVLGGLASAFTVSPELIIEALH